MSENNKLIEEFKNSVAQKNRARIAIGGLILTTVVLFSFVAWKSLNGFLDSGVPEISNLLISRLTKNSDNYLQQVNSSASKVAPVYSREMQSALEKEWPNIEKAGEAELVALNKYTQNKWPEIQSNLSKIADDQNKVIKEELSKVLGQEQSEQIVESYTLAALDNFNNVIKSSFAQHTATGHSVGENLSKIVEREPDVNSDVDMNEAVGLSLEVLGSELQEIGKK